MLVVFYLLELVLKFDVVLFLVVAVVVFDPLLFIAQVCLVVVQREFANAPHVLRIFTAKVRLDLAEVSEQTRLRHS